MKRSSLAVLSLLAALIAAGCTGSAGAPSLFLLDNSYPAEKRAMQSDPVLVIDSVSLAPYLANSGIVYQTEPHRVVVANNNRWASPLAAQLTDGLDAALGNVLDDISVVRTAGRAPPNALHLATHVEKFIGHYDGYAHVAGQWQLVDSSGKRLASHRFEQRIPLERNGYAALVDSLSRGWRMTAKQMAPTLKKDISTH